MISEGGAASVTMRAIGARLGVSRAAPYRHFRDKAALFVAVAAQGFRRLSDRLRLPNEAPVEAPIGQLRRMGEEYVRFALEHPAHYRLMWGREALERRNEPELHVAAAALLERLVRVIERHQQAGDIERHDPLSQAYTAWSAVHGLASLLIERQIDPQIDVDELIAQTISTLVDGLRPRLDELSERPSAEISPPSRGAQARQRRTGCNRGAARRPSRR